MTDKLGSESLEEKASRPTISMSDFAGKKKKIIDTLRKIGTTGLPPSPKKQLELEKAELLAKKEEDDLTDEETERLKEINYDLERL